MARFSLGEDIVFSKKALSLFDTRTANAILREAIRAAGERWLELYLPKRFDKAYMRRAPFRHFIEQLSYRQKVRKALFQGQIPNKSQWRGNTFGFKPMFDFSTLEPLVMSGRMRESVISRGYVEARSTNRNPRAVIRMPLPHAVRPETRRPLQIITKREMQVMANRFKNTVTAYVNNSTAKKTKRGKPVRSGRRILAGIATDLRTRRMMRWD